MIEKITLIMGIITGSICLLAAVYNHIRYQNFGVGGSVLITFGTLLLGLSFWQSVELSIDADGTLKAIYQKENTGAEAAIQNSQIAALKLRISEISEDIGLLKQSTPGASLSQQQLISRKNIEEKFQGNSKYSILIFNKNEQNNIAHHFSDALLEKGYQSSATTSDLSESPKKLASNEALVIYTEQGKELLPELKKIFINAAEGIKYVADNKPRELLRGDVQVLIF